MLTVMKNTKNPVKFWFLKNFLSPSLTVFYYVFVAYFQIYEVCHTIHLFFYEMSNSTSCVFVACLNSLYFRFTRLFFLTWPKSMALSMNLFSITGPIGCMLRQKSRGPFGGESIETLCHIKLYILRWCSYTDVCCDAVGVLSF